MSWDRLFLCLAGDLFQEINYHSLVFQQGVEGSLVVNNMFLIGNNRILVCLNIALVRKDI
jgi:hypothetical protein